MLAVSARRRTSTGADSSLLPVVFALGRHVRCCAVCVSVARGRRRVGPPAASVLGFNSQPHPPTLLSRL